MSDPQKPFGLIRSALTTAAVGIGAGWVLAAAVVTLAGGRDPRVAADAWLVAHGSGIRVGDASIRLVPLGATALCFAWMAYVARRRPAPGLGDLGPYVGIVGAVYGVVSALLAAVTATDSVIISIPRAAAAGFLVGGLGSMTGAGWPHRTTWSVHPQIALILRGAARAAGAVLVASLVLVLAMLAIHGRRAGELWGLLDPGIVGGVLLSVACILSLPTLVLWAASVLVGPGFVLGSDTSVDLSGAYLGAIPGFPTLAAVPPPGRFSEFVLILGVVVPAAGIWAGTVSRRIRVGAWAGALAGLVLGLAIALSGGGIGPGRMAEAGAPPVTPLLVAIPVLALCGALGSAARGVWSDHYGGGRDSTRPRRTNRRPRVRGGDQSPGAD